MAGIIITDNSDEVLAAIHDGISAALEAVGNQAVSNAKQNITKEDRVNTGNLRNSISHAVQDDSVYIGTNVSYAIFNEMGTGIYIGGGRQSPWSYRDDSGKWHRTRGLPPIHFLRNAARDHANEYLGIIKSIMQQHRP